MNDSKAITKKTIEADDNAVMQASDALSYGELVAVPTETVYGLAAVATNGRAVARIFEAKGRPNFNPLICHVADIEMAKSLVITSPLVEGIMQQFWPGPLTLVLPARENNGLSDLVSAGLETLAVRMPANSFTRDIIKRLGKPIAAPSANSSGKISPTTAAHVLEDLAEQVAMVVDDGPCPEGIESTIISIIDDEIALLRPGTITADEINTATGAQVQERSSDKIIAPGMMVRHYAPDKPVVLNMREADAGMHLIGFGEVDGETNLSTAGDLREAAANLFALLRHANHSAAATIGVAPIPFKGLGIAINDRLTRAAAPKD